MKGKRVVDQDTQKIIQELIAIAKTVPMIKRMWLFGSRVKGTATDGSDLDLAVEIEWIPGLMLGACEDPFSLWCAVLPHFEKRMKDISPWPLDLQNLVDEKATPNVFAYIRENSQLVYEKA
jgi:hypothetical protein